MNEIVGLLGLAAFVIASLLVGGRIALLAIRARQLPETAMALSLILSGGVGTALLVTPALLGNLEVGTVYRLSQLATISNHAGFVFLYLFVWRVFRPGDLWAACLVFSSTGILLIGAVGTMVTLVPGGGFPGVNRAGDVWFWMSLLSRMVVYGWAMIESFRYYRMLKRRLALGLASEVIVNRFFYWGVSMGAVLGIWINIAITVLNLDLAWLVKINDLISAALGFVVAGAVYLAFFPGSRESTVASSNAASPEVAKR